MFSKDYMSEPKIFLGSELSDLDFVSELEELGEQILIDRQEIVDIDRRRNLDREALRVLSKYPNPEKKTWITVGSMLIKVPIKKAKEILEKEQVVLNSEVNKLRSELKVKVNRLRDMEHKPPVPGLMLNPLSKEEMAAINQVMGVNS